MHCWLTMVTLASVMRHCIPWIPHANHKWFIKPGRSNEPICPNVNRIFVRHLKGINSFVVEVKSWTRRQIKKKKRCKSMHLEALKGFEMPGHPQKEPTPTPVAFTAAARLHQPPLFMPYSAASIRPRPLTLHVTLSFTVTLTSTHHQTQSRCAAWIH